MQSRAIKTTDAWVRPCEIPFAHGTNLDMYTDHEMENYMHRSSLYDYRWGTWSRERIRKVGRGSPKKNWALIKKKMEQNTERPPINLTKFVTNFSRWDSLKYTRVFRISACYIASRTLVPGYFDAWYKFSSSRWSYVTEKKEHLIGVIDTSDEMDGCILGIAPSGSTKMHLKRLKCTRSFMPRTGWMQSCKTDYPSGDHFSVVHRIIYSHHFFM